MSMPFTIRFTRWTKQAVREQSAGKSVQADSFKDAYNQARLLCEGMNAADDNAEYEICVIQQDGIGGEWHTGIGGLWKSES